MTTGVYLIVNDAGHYFSYRVFGFPEPVWNDNIGLAWIYRTRLIAEDIARQVGGKVIG